MREQPGGGGPAAMFGRARAVNSIFAFPTGMMVPSAAVDGNGEQKKGSACVHVTCVALREG